MTNPTLQYLSLPHIKISAIAKAVGVTTPYLHNCVKGRDKLSPEVERRIIEYLKQNWIDPK